MPIAFRCTRCRAKLHVPTRWGGTSVACPKCSTRVMVPGQASGSSATPFEDKAVERSLEALQRPPGGIFAGESFELPEAGQDAEVADSDGVLPAASVGLLVPWWALYAGTVVVVATAVGSFLAGARWAGQSAAVAPTSTLERQTP